MNKVNTKRIFYCVDCNSKNIVEEVVMCINNNEVLDSIQDSTYCFDCNSILISHRRED